MALYPFYNLPKIKIEEEYTLMDAAGIITATGGSLSIFVGLSCYGFVWKVFEWLEESFRGPRRSPGKRHRVKDMRDDDTLPKVKVNGLNLGALERY